MGAFRRSGSYATSASGNARGRIRGGPVRRAAPGLALSGRAAGAVRPDVARRWPACRASGGGLGDVAANARFDVINAGTRGAWPGLAILAGLPSRRGGPRRGGRSARDVGHRNGIVRGQPGPRRRGDHRAGIRVARPASCRNGRARAANGVEQTFAPRLSAVLTGGYTFGHDTTVGAFASRCGRATRATRAARSRTAASRWSPPAPRWRCRSGTPGGCRRRCSATCRSPAGAAIRRSGSAAPSPSSASGSDDASARYG